MHENLKVPLDLYFTNDHTWVFVEKNIGTIGLTDYAQSELSEIVYVELPAVGSEVVQGLPFGTIEAMKTVAELISPMTGEVIEMNESLEDNPGHVNTDPYGEGWMIKIKIHDHDEIENILTPKDYIMYISGEDV